MRAFWDRHKEPILVGIILAAIVLTVLPYFFPDSAPGRLITYYSGMSPLVIVLLTLAYVVTTTRQLLAMQRQLAVMESSVKLQLQPLPVPYLTDLRLERIRPYLGPETGFLKILMVSRFHFSIRFRNAGTGAALNVAVFASILVEGEHEKRVEIPQSGLDQVALVCEGEPQAHSDTCDVMILDNHYEMFRALTSQHPVTLRLRVYYKNVFGSGFFEEAQYTLAFAEDQSELVERWRQFLDHGIDELRKEMTRFESLKPRLPEEAKEAYDRIRAKLAQQFDKDLQVAYEIAPTSFDVQIVDYVKSLQAEYANRVTLMQVYDPARVRLVGQTLECGGHWS